MEIQALKSDKDLCLDSKQTLQCQTLPTGISLCVEAKAKVFRGMGALALRPEPSVLGLLSDTETT